MYRLEGGKVIKKKISFSRAFIINDVFLSYTYTQHTFSFNYEASNREKICC